MKIRDVIDGKYACFDKMGPLNKSAQIEAVCHLQFLMATSGIDANDWDLQEVFGTGDGNKIHQMKNELNRRFFEYTKIHNLGLNPQLEPFSKAIKDGVNKACRNYKEQLRRRTHDAIRSVNRQIDSCYSSLQAYHASLSASLQTMADLDSKDLKISDSLSEGLRSGFFTVEGYEEGIQVLKLKTQPVTLTHRNPAQGVDLRIPMGTYRVKINLVEQNLKVMLGENNQVYNGVPHPYVGHFGDVCFGEASRTYNEYVRGYQIGEQLKLLESLLKSYSETSTPYYALAHFRNAKLFNLPDHRKKYDYGSCTTCGGAIDRGCNCKDNPYNLVAGAKAVQASIIDADEIEEEVCADCEENLEHCSCHDSPEEEERATF